jgi:hypothetical protein
MSENWKAGLFLCTILCILYAQPVAQNAVSATPVYITVIDFDTSQLNRYRENPDYQYQRKAPKTSWLESLWQRIVGYFKHLFSAGTSLSTRILMVVLIAGAILALTYFFMRAKFHSVFMKRNRRTGYMMRILDEDVPVSTLSSRISAAVAAGDYRMAYRWTYIDLLRYLDTKRVIRIVGNKTNSDYLREVDSQSWSKDFAILADAFDFIWYGEYPVDQQSFQRYQAIASQLIHQTSPS